MLSKLKAVCLKSPPAPSDSNVLCNETSSLTSDRLSTKARHRWTIDRFLHTLGKTAPNTYLKSAQFHCQGTDLDTSKRRFTFEIWLMPKSTAESDAIGAFLINRSTEEVNVTYSFQLERTDGTLLKPSAKDVPEARLPPDNRRGLPAAFSWADLKPSLEKMVGLGSVVVVCEMEVFFTSRRSELSTLLSRVRSASNAYPIKADMSRMIGNPVFSDVCLSCEGQSFPCHKVVLAARSDVFAAMFAHSECEESVSSVVRIEDANPVVLMAFVKYMYSDEVDFAKEPYAQQLLALSDKYNVGSLKLRCEYSLCCSISLANAVELALLAHLHEADILMKMTLEFMASHLEEVSGTSEWKRVMEANPQLMGKVLNVVARKK